MPKKKKNNHPLINPVPREAIADIGGEEDFVDFLRHELSWPIPTAIERFEDIVIPHELQSDFGFSAGKDRIQYPTSPLKNGIFDKHPVSSKGSFNW